MDPTFGGGIGNAKGSNFGFTKRALRDGCSTDQRAVSCATMASHKSSEKSAGAKDKRLGRFLHVHTNVLGLGQCFYLPLGTTYNKLKDGLASRLGPRVERCRDQIVWMCRCPRAGPCLFQICLSFRRCKSPLDVGAIPAASTRILTPLDSAASRRGRSAPRNSAAIAIGIKYR